MLRALEIGRTNVTHHLCVEGNSLCDGVSKCGSALSTEGALLFIELCAFIGFVFRQHTSASHHALGEGL